MTGGNNKRRNLAVPPKTTPALMRKSKSIQPNSQVPSERRWANDSQEALILALLLSRYPEPVEVFELAAIALQYNRALKTLRTMGCVIPNSFFRVSAAGERRSRYRLVWCPAELAPEGHPATRGSRPEMPPRSTKPEPHLPATKAQIERSRTLSFKALPDQKFGGRTSDSDALTFRRAIDDSPAPSTPSLFGSLSLVRRHRDDG